MFPPKIASLFGVIPHSEILNRIADKAIPFTITVTIDSPSKTKFPILPLAFLDVSAIEKKISAITPISNALKIKRNSLSLYGFLPVKIKATRYTTSVTSASGTGSNTTNRLCADPVKSYKKKYQGFKRHAGFYFL